MPVTRHRQVPKIGVRSILGDQFAQEVNNPEVEITPAAKALAAEVQTLETTDLDIDGLVTRLEAERAVARSSGRARLPSFDGTPPGAA